jgi:uncharacterized protein YeaO (DUF488 family)
MVRLKRVYDRPDRSDGIRILVDRLWPRGLTKRAAAVDEWVKEIAPSPALRRWFDHDPKKWPEFRRRYRRELRAHAVLIEAIAREAMHHPVTLVYGARDEEHNDAVVLSDVIDSRIRRLKE